MSNYIKAPAEGDRIDMGGKLPQFDAFASFAYKELLRGNLEWIRVADPKADKVDDIQYATRSHIHAYQMKWSNQAKPPKFTYLNFLELLPELISGWKALSVLHRSEHKDLVIHLISNRQPSVDDVIESQPKTKAGNFKEFIQEVYEPLKQNIVIRNEWKDVAENFKKNTGLSDKDFQLFVSALDINLGYQIPPLTSVSEPEAQKSEDVLKISRLIIDEVASKSRQVHYTKEDLIKALGWEYRFRTTFCQEFQIDKAHYQPIATTIKTLDDYVNSLQTGYVFFSGSPGSGKSTLLTSWAKENTKDRVVRYYAFSNTSLSQNDSNRGEAAYMYFDLVIELNSNSPALKKEVLPYHDEVYLKKLFYEQLDELSDDFKKTGRKTIIIVDGLDHITREYRPVKSLLNSLPPPSALPQGIIVILGSQTFELDGLQVDVSVARQKNKTNIQIDSLDRKAVKKFAESFEPVVSLTPDQHEKVFNVSKGHPLQLQYLLEELSANADQKDEILGRADFYSENIADYYEKIWLGIQSNNELKELLGLLARIRGEINLDFVKEWGFSQDTLMEFRKRAFHLFSKSDKFLTFFHNSFRQFILYKTALDPVTGEYDKKADQDAHARLAHHYASSKTEPAWNRFVHLYKSRQFDEFVRGLTREEIMHQLLSYRPSEKIKQDLKLGIHLANEQKSSVLLTRYLLMLSELNARMQTLDPAIFVKEHLMLGRSRIVKDYLRDDHILNASSKFAIETAIDMFFASEKSEGKLIFSMAEPDEIKENGIVTETDPQGSNEKVLERWAEAAVLYHDPTQVLAIIENTTIVQIENVVNQPKYDLQSRLLFYAGGMLVSLKNWNEFDKVLVKFNTADKFESQLLILLLADAVGGGESSEVRKKYQDILLNKFSTKTTDDGERLLIADILAKNGGSTEVIKEWISGIPQPKLNQNDYSERYDLRSYRPRIRLNTLLNLTGQGVDIFTAVPAGGEASLVEFERMLCLIAQLDADAILKKSSSQVVNRIKPIVGFYYRQWSHRDVQRYTLERLRKDYFKYLIRVIKKFGTKVLDEVLAFFLNEFEARSSSWKASQQSEILFELAAAGADKLKIVPLTRRRKSALLS